MPELLNPKITIETKATAKKTLVTEHKQIWYKYYLDQAINPYSVVAIVASTNPHYLAKKEMDYVGFAEEITQYLFIHL
jgi:hypothetical protein